MKSELILDKRLVDSTFFVTEMSVSQLLLRDDKNFPWLILVPKVANATEINDLSRIQQSQLMQEISECSRILATIFQPDKVNVGMLGNIVSQLHIHIVARYITDLCWPHAVWQGGLSVDRYSKAESEFFLQELRSHFIAIPS